MLDLGFRSLFVTEYADLYLVIVVGYGAIHAISAVSPNLKLSAKTSAACCKLYADMEVELEPSYLPNRSMVEPYGM